MTVFGYGITLDVLNLPFAVMDLDGSRDSRPPSPAISTIVITQRMRSAGSRTRGSR